MASVVGGGGSFSPNPHLCRGALRSGPLPFASACTGQYGGALPAHPAFTGLPAPCWASPWEVGLELVLCTQLRTDGESPSEGEGHCSKNSTGVRGKKGSGGRSGAQPCPLLCLVAFANDHVAGPAENAPKAVAFSPSLLGGLCFFLTPWDIKLAFCFLGLPLPFAELLFTAVPDCCHI